MSLSFGNADKGLAGVSLSKQLAGLQPQGPLAYTTFDLFRHFAWVLSILKFVAHVFSLPLMVFLRKNLGMRYVDEVHIIVSFLIWQMVGAFPLLGNSADNWIANFASPLIALIGWIFLPVAMFHRYRAKKAALRRVGYSYYPGMPLLAPALLFAVGVIFRIPGRFIRLPRFLTHPGEVFTPEIVQSMVRRWFEPALIAAMAIVLMLAGISEGFCIFLIWTAALLSADESLSQRGMWELYLDLVDAQVLAEEKQRLLSGGEGISRTNGMSLASLADLRSLAKANGRK